MGGRVSSRAARTMEFLDFFSGSRGRSPSQTLRKRAKALRRDRVNSADDRVNGNNDRVNDRVKNEEEGNQEGLRHCLYAKILQNPGKKSKELSLLVNKSVPTVSRYLKLLKVANQIEFRGAPKTGGYYANS